MENFGKAKLSWLKTFLKLPEGIPSHDTFNRVFSLLDPKKLGDCFLKWTRAVYSTTKGEVISIDGKTICGSRDKGKKSIVHMLALSFVPQDTCAAHVVKDLYDYITKNTILRNGNKVVDIKANIESLSACNSAG